MTLTVLVPDEFGVETLSQVDGVRPVLYQPGQPLPAEAADAEVLVPRFLAGTTFADLLAQLPKLRLVQLLSAGAENFVGQLPDGVQLATARGAHGGSTAEWVLAALLSIYREFPVFDRARQEHRWDYHATDTLQGKRVLVVGAGDLGEQVRRRLSAFDAESTLVGRTSRPGVYGVADLPELLGDHDAVVLVVPLTSETRGMVDAGFLARMPDNAVLVNAARGAVVDTDALIAELTAGRLRAALDVTDPEPLPAEHPLWRAPGLLLTPHVAGSCRGQQERSYRVAAEQVAQFAAGREPSNLVRGEY
ncbi:2-hydroxyacid dehydrogenase [Goodfellowiella coeruleoviolacea]|uniref:2-hydroxyacid dehydrogenase n=1 Tax=Goodfellowiella coeruleoviolacea TaxID=334858 RepID=UPI0020A53A51|nr:2-hydroxyacid dehydrogenase [Goodfellowiella coeruleoviolacea]